MNILIVGDGAREHALAHKIGESDFVEKIFVAPGNGGTRNEKKCSNIEINNLIELRDFALSEGVGITVVGPEACLMEGIVDLFEEKGLKIIGPNKAAALLEGSKSFAKDFMVKYGIRTAKYETFTEAKMAKAYAKSLGYPVVIKADGLAQGKGVEIAGSEAEANFVIESYIMEKKFKDASSKIVVEEFLEGKEASLITIFDGEHIIPLRSSMDHKKILEGEKGMNTGGMGSISPNPYFTQTVEDDFRENILKRTLVGLKSEGLIFRGIIFFGLMLTEKGVYLLEYNLRFGDPETQGLLYTLRSDLVNVMVKSLEGNLSEEDIHYDEDTALCVVLASKGYPLGYKKNIDVTQVIANAPEGVKIYAYASDELNGKIYSQGGRVLSVVASGKGDDVFKKVYGYLDELQEPDLIFRKDIGRI
ncbi:MAG: phosphoribosylamine--glycine ligase [Clostridiaceae bacterium]